MVNFPVTPDTQTTLLEETNIARSPLTSTIDSLDGPGATFDVDSGAAFPNNNFLVTVSAEILLISSRAANVLTIAERGAEGTIVVTHAPGEQVGNTYTAGSRQITKQAQIDHQNYLFNLKGKAISRTITDPTPLTPALYDQYIVPTGAVNDWAGQDGTLAYWDGSAWSFITPIDGDRLYCLEDSDILKSQGGAWVVDQPIPVYDSTLSWVAGSVILQGGELWRIVAALPEGTAFDGENPAQFVPLTGTQANQPIGDWAQLTYYVAGAVLIDTTTGLAYRAINTHTSPGAGDLLDDAANWEPITAKYRGDWDTREDYRGADVVQFAQQFYRANIAIAPGGNDPVTPPNDWGQVSGAVFTDDVFRVLDDADNTKQYALELAGFTTGQTRTTTPADRDMDLGRVADDYIVGANYDAGDLCLFVSGIYQANQQILNAPTFNAADWTLLSNPAVVTAPGRQALRVTGSATIPDLVAESSPIIICDNGATPMTLTMPELTPTNPLGNHWTVIQVGTGLVSVAGVNANVILDGIAGPTPADLSAAREIYDWYMTVDNGNTWESSDSATALNDLTDVDAPAPADGEVLRWVATNGLWEPSEIETANRFQSLTSFAITLNAWYKVAGGALVQGTIKAGFDWFETGAGNEQEITIDVSGNDVLASINVVSANANNVFNAVRYIEQGNSEFALEFRAAVTGVIDRQSYQGDLNYYDDLASLQTLTPTVGGTNLGQVDIIESIGNGVGPWVNVLLIGTTIGTFRTRLIGTHTVQMEMRINKSGSYIGGGPVGQIDLAHRPITGSAMPIFLAGHKSGQDGDFSRISIAGDGTVTVLNNGSTQDMTCLATWNK